MFLTRLISELKRRNVFRVAVVYVLAAWVTMQIADVMFPALNLPDWSITLTAALLVIGFPMVILFAWIFEITPEGLRLERDVEAGKSITHITGRQLDYIIIALLTGIILYLLVTQNVLDQPRLEQRGFENENVARAVAVLPFRNHSADKENSEFFAIGIHADLLTLLTKLQDVRVISHDSVGRYKNTDKSIGAIGQELGVSTILQGEVRLAGEHVRINVQLLDVNTGRHLWAETYDKVLTAENLFDIQAEIAAAIASVLQTSMVGPRQLRASRPTENLGAYRAFLLGRHRMASRTSKGLGEAIEYFDSAIKQDPKFAIAYVSLADAYALMNIYGGLGLEEMLRTAEAMLDKAIALDDQLPEAYASLGNLREFRRNFEGAEAAYQRAIALNPSYSTAYHWYGHLLGNSLGRPGDALQQLAAAIELDPLSPVINMTIGEALVYSGRYADALLQYQKVLEIEPDYADAFREIGRSYWELFSDFGQAAKNLRTASELDPGNPEIPSLLGMLYLDLGEPAAANNCIRAAIAAGPAQFWPNLAKGLFETYMGQRADVGKAWQSLGDQMYLDRNMLLRLLRDTTISDDDTNANATLRMFGQIYPALVESGTVTVTNYQAAIDLSYVLQRIGQPDRARELLAKSAKIVQRGLRNHMHGYVIEDAEIFALQGNRGLALKALRRAVGEGWRFLWWWRIEHNLNLASLRDDPDFRSLVNDLRADSRRRLGEVEPSPADCMLPN